jgi:POT family proton-dependent oligopeptide transporter
MTAPAPADDSAVATSASAAALQAASASAASRDDRMPRGIPFIVANEFAERFCYYGISSILTVYLVQVLLFGEADANVFSSFFTWAAYSFPVVGAIVSDVFWGKFRTIMVFSMVYAVGCTVVALVPGVSGLSLGLFLVAFGTGGIKPCVSTNVGDQFTSKNQHLIDRAFSYFYLAINWGSSISIFLCPVLLEKYGRVVAFGMPAAMMYVATGAFWLGRNRFAVVPPAGKTWLRDVFSKDGLKTIGSLAIVYLFVAFFWSLWNQANGQTWTLQARSSLMDKYVGIGSFGITLLPAQIQVVNGLFILALVPIFTFGIYPLWSKVFRVTPLRKIAVGLFTIASSYLIVARIEGRIQAGHTVSVWWQILAYVVLTASEVLVSITALEFSYKQAPLRMKSFIMALYLLSIASGSLITAAVNYGITKPLHATAVEVGTQTWVHLDEVSGFVVGQKVDFHGASGVTILDSNSKGRPLEGTYLVHEVDPAHARVELMDVVDRKPIVTQGTFDTSGSRVSTYRLVGPQYFEFFVMLMAVVGVMFIFVAMRYREKTHLRDEQQAQTA